MQTPQKIPCIGFKNGFLHSTQCTEGLKCKQVAASQGCHKTKTNKINLFLLLLFALKKMTHITDLKHSENSEKMRIT